ncbi:MAG: hypothetical protein QOH21_3269 [Acidobacteriota bacterium]|nr:hypothetical protein [Acidobacteriota bacterium]
MDTIRNTNLDLPSGFEVESAAFVVVPEEGLTSPSPAHGGMRGKLDHWKERGTESIHSLQRSLSDRGDMLKQNVTARSLAMKSLVRIEVDDQVMKINSSMRVHPMKWAGIAAGAGFGLGLIGRLMHKRSHHRHHHQPQLVIIDAC